VAVEAFVGYQGDGKTYTLAEIGLAAIAEGRQVATNFFLQGETRSVPEWIDVLRIGLEDGAWLVLLDEMGQLAPARGWAKFPPAFMLLVTQTRKLGLDLYYSCQNLDQVDKYVRDVTSRVTRCKGYFGVPAPCEHDPKRKRPRLIVRRSFGGQDFGRAKARSQGTVFRRFDVSVAESFDTYRMIRASRHLLEKQIAELLGDEGSVEGPGGVHAMTEIRIAAPVPQGRAAKAAKRP